jgi:hypothetical protein
MKQAGNTQSPITVALPLEREELKLQFFIERTLEMQAPDEYPIAEAGLEEDRFHANSP